VVVVEKRTRKTKTKSSINDKVSKKAFFAAVQKEEEYREDYRYETVSPIFWRRLPSVNEDARQLSEEEGDFFNESITTV